MRQLCSQLACVVFEDSRILRDMDGGATAKGGGLEGAMFPVERRGGGHSKIKSRKPWAGADEQS